LPISAIAIIVAEIVDYSRYSVVEALRVRGLAMAIHKTGVATD